MFLPPAFPAASLNRRAAPRRLPAAVITLLLLFLLAMPAPAHALRAVFFSDTQGETGQFSNFINEQETNTVVAAILAMKPRPDMVFCLGDLAGAGFTEKTGYQFKNWKNLMQPIMQAGIPLYVVKGNHELMRQRKKGDPSPIRYFLQNQKEYARAFSSMPGNGPKGHKHLAYTVTDKATRTVFVALDSYYIDRDMDKTLNAFGHISRAQLDWLRGPLPAVDKAVHRIVLSHAPAFNSKRKLPRFPDDSFQELWSILEEKHFTLMIAAHVHHFSFARVDSVIYPSSRRPVAQVIIGPVGGVQSKESMVHSNPALWKTSVKRNFLLLEIDGPKPEDPIRLTPYMKNADGAYVPAAPIIVGKGPAGK